MRRRKIMIPRQQKHLAPAKLDESNITDIDLTFTLNLEFEGVRNFDLQKLTLGLEQQSAIQRAKEIITFKSYLMKLKTSAKTQHTKLQLFSKAIKDLNSIGASLSFFSTEAVASLYDFYLNQKKSGEISESTLKNKRKQLVLIWRDCYGIKPEVIEEHFPDAAKRTGKLHGATIVKDINNSGVSSKSYSQKDFRLLKRMFISFGRKLSKLFANNATEVDIRSKKLVFTYDKGKHHINVEKIKSNPVAGSLLNTLANKATVFYLMLFISLTACNLAPAMRLKRKHLVIKPAERDLYTIELNDRRKSKIRNAPHVVKKYQLRLIYEILEHSTLIDGSKDALLFPRLTVDGVKSFSESAVNSQLQTFRVRPLVGELGEKLHVSAQKLRDSHGQMFSDIGERREILGNSKSVASRHYTDGNPVENTDKLQQGMNAYALSLLSGEPLRDIKKRFNPEIDINLIDSEEGNTILKDSYASKTLSGGICRNGVTSPEASKHNRKVKSLKLINELEIHCNNIIACFTCANHVFVLEEEHLYLLYSFKLYLEASLYSNEAGGLFGNRELVDKAIGEIQWMLDNKYPASMVRSVKNRINSHGVHPLWKFD